MTERREPIRIGADDGLPPTLGRDDPAGRPRPGPRLGRLVGSPATRRLALSRVGRVASIGLVAAVLLVAGGSSLWRRAVDWLHHRPEYQVAFRDIRLVPEPPPWVRGGRAALLQEVLADRPDLETFSILDARLDVLLADFRRNPWVVRADRIVGARPDAIAVHLDYREPVATVRVGKLVYALDPESVVLPRDGVDLDKAAPLLEIRAPRPDGDLKPGLPYPAEETAGGNPPVVLATRLAAFLKGRALREPGVADLLGFKTILVQRDKGGREYLWVVGAKKNFLLWGNVEKLGSPAEPGDFNKWGMLKTWAEERGPWKADPDREYLEFTPGGVRSSPFEPRAARDPGGPSGRNGGPAVPLG